MIVLDFAEKTLHQVSVSIKVGAERWHVLPIGHQLDVDPNVANFEALS